MGRPSHTRRLDLWMNGELVGYWTVSRRRDDEFAYADSWLASPLHRPLSLSLPIRPGNEPYRGPRVSAWFENLLPDSRPIRQRLARRFHAETTDAFDLLTQIGRDCVGALQILPHGELPPPARIEGEPLDEEDVARLLAETVAPVSPLASLADGEGDLRISLAGAQEKTALLRQGGRWYRPLGATPTTHILKLPLGVIGGLQIDMSRSVENEWLCARIVHAFGLPVATCEIADFAGQRVLLVERFDRRLADDGSRLLRLPQEDMCQALGIAPVLKYERDGGPGMLPLLKLLEGSARSVQDREIFLTAQILFWLLRAPDGHAKNFSLRLLPRGAYELTPLYDVLSAFPVLGTGKNSVSPHKVALAMAVHGSNTHFKMREIQRRHWNQMARACGLGSSAEPIIGRLLDTGAAVIAQVQEGLPRDFPGDLADRIFHGLTDSLERLARMTAA